VLRGAATHIDSQTRPFDKKKIIETLRIRDLAAELHLEVHPKDNFVLRLQSDAGENFATISITSNSTERKITINSVAAPLPGAPGSPVDLNIFLDGSVLEVFANRTTSLTARIYDAPKSPLRLKFENDADPASLDVWEMTPISTDRLTGSLCSPTRTTAPSHRKISKPA